jgi:CMP-N-acetylneuraminic acid synthetase
VKIAVIPARGGSKRIPQKNIRMLCGKPIMTYSVAAAQDTGLFDQIIVSTDDQEIASVARGAGPLITMPGGATAVPLFSHRSIGLAVPRILVQDIDTLEDWEQAELHQR